MAIATTAGCLAQKKAPKEVRAQLTTRATGSLDFIADSIEYRSDLTRLYGRLMGMPHTSNRIDMMMLMVDNQAADATDIDGVDFKRWFQWEDEGVIPVEIDFPAMKPQRAWVVKLSGPRGESSWVINEKGGAPK